MRTPRPVTLPCGRAGGDGDHDDEGVDDDDDEDENMTRLTTRLNEALTRSPLQPVDHTSLRLSFTDSGAPK
jgi:hypothetical protein